MRRLTARDALTRDRIVRAAADLMHANGVAGTTMDQVVEAPGTSKSQLYHYFEGKDALVTAVIKTQAALVMQRQEPHLEQLNSLQGLRRWRDAIVRFVDERHGAYWCVIGSLASELTDRSEPARILINATFQNWESYLEAGIRRMQERGELDTNADPAELATGIMAAYQGRLLALPGRTKCAADGAGARPRDPQRGSARDTAETCIRHSELISSTSTKRGHPAAVTK